MNLLMLVTGLCLALIGVCVSFTGIGALIGVPLALLGGAMFGVAFRRMADGSPKATVAQDADAPPPGLQVEPLD